MKTSIKALTATIVVLLAARLADAGMTARVSNSWTVGTAIAAISADGSVVAFVALAPSGALDPRDSNRKADVYVQERATGVITRVSVSADGGSGDGDSSYPKLSVDGRFVVFDSYSGNLVAGDTNEQVDVFVHDRVTGQTERVSVDSAGVEGNSWSDGGGISADGRFVAFLSDASNLIANDTNGWADVFVHDRQTGANERVNVSSTGDEANAFTFNPVAISADGNVVAFTSLASNLVTDDTNIEGDIFVHDRASGQTERVSVDSSEVQGDGFSYPASLSADGNFVAFASSATNLVAGDTNGTRDLFVRDRAGASTVRVNVASGGAQSEGDEEEYPYLEPSISADGRFISFASEATDLVAGDTNGLSDIFVHDRQNVETSRVSVSSTGEQAVESEDYGSSSYLGALSADGRFVVFDAVARNLVPGDGRSYDVYVHDRLRTCGNGISEDGEQCDDGNLLDGDGCEALCTPTVCAGGIAIGRARLSLQPLTGPAGDEVVHLKGELRFPSPSTPSFDPSVDGAQLVITDVGTGGAAVYDLTAPAAAVPPAGEECGAGDGWRVNAARNVQQYRNASTSIDFPACTPGSANGLQTLRLADQRARGGAIKFAAVAEGSMLRSPSGPLRITLALSAPSVNGACGSYEFPAEDCRFDGSSLRCH